MFQKHLSLAIVVFLLASCGCYYGDGGIHSRNYYNTTKCDFVLDQLYSGLRMPGGEISEEEWNRFVNDVITQRFPNGFTVIDGYGQWRNKNGEIIKEKTKVVQVLYRNGSKTDNSIDEIIEEYKTKFTQESVLRVTSCPEVIF
jgi:Protein of unknown function (DUF3574).